MPEVSKGRDRIVEEHDAEARDDRVEACGFGGVDLGVGEDELGARAFPFGARPGGGAHRTRNVEPDAATPPAKPPRTGERPAARAAAAGGQIYNKNGAPGKR